MEQIWSSAHRNIIETRSSCCCTGISERPGFVGSGSIYDRSRGTFRNPGVSGRYATGHRLESLRRGVESVGDGDGTVEVDGEQRSVRLLRKRHDGSQLSTERTPHSSPNRRSWFLYPRNNDRCLYGCCTRYHRSFEVAVVIVVIVFVVVIVIASQLVVVFSHVKLKYGRT